MTEENKKSVIDLAGEELQGVIAKMVEQKMTEEKAKQATPEMQQAAFQKIASTEPEGWKGAGDFAKAFALKALGRFEDPRFSRFSKAPTGMNAGIPTEGGLALPETISTDLLADIVADPTNLMSRCRRLDNVKGSLKLVVGEDNDRSGGLVYGGVKVYRVPEAGQITGSKAALRSVTFTPKAIHGLVYLTDELLDQTGNVLEQFVTSAVTEAFAMAHNEEIIRGIAAAGQFEGILNSGSLITVAKETGQANDTVVSENITKMVVRLRTVFRNNAIWLANPDVEAQLRQMTIGTSGDGSPVFLPPGGFSGAPYGMLDGRPIVYSDHCSALGDLGDLMFADLSQYMVVTGGPTKAAASMHLRFDYAETALRWTMYTDGKPLNNKVFAPKNGSTKSPFVVLAAR